MKTSKYYARKIVDESLQINDSRMAELLADAVEDSPKDLDWEDQGSLHEDIEIAIESDARMTVENHLSRELEQDPD
jgi:hypothetical protein